MEDARTLREIRDDFRDFAKSVSPNAYLSVRLSEDPACVVRGSFYPDGVLGTTNFTFKGDDWADLKAQLVAKWETHKDTHAANLVRSLALQIISITADQGECTDAALRGAKFSAEDVSFYGERACAEAERIASTGPFTITRLSGANAQAA